MRLRPRPATRLARPRVEILEDRQLLSVFTVTTTADAGPGSLRQAILDANAHPGPDTIAFAVKGAGVQRIQPATSLPAVTDPVTLDAGSQPGYGGVPLIELNGAAAGAGAVGLAVNADNSTVRGLTVNGFAHAGITLNGSGNRVTGDYVGTDATGAAAVPNGVGVVVLEGEGNAIGGADPRDRNIIAGNDQEGVLIEGRNNVVAGNLIGTDAAGTAAVPNRWGVCVLGDPFETRGAGNTIGGSAPGAGNVIAGNLTAGVRVVGHSARGNVVAGNLIGTDATGTTALPNGEGVAVEGASFTVVGGTAPGAGNVIAGNQGAGLALRFQLFGAVVQGNFIGTDDTGSCALPNETGLSIAQATANTIGGPDPAAGNLISGNRTAGVFLDADAQLNLIQGNLIGTDATGKAPLGNGTGVWVNRGAQYNLIGGPEAGAGNVISGNLAEGVAVTSASHVAVQGNFIGTDTSTGLDLGNGGAGVAVTGAMGSNVTVGGTADGTGNVIAHNGGAGVLIDGATSNPVRGNSLFADAVAGIALTRNGNRNQPAPELTTAVFDGSQTKAEGSLTATPSTTYDLEFFSSMVCHPSGYGEGEIYLGAGSVTAGANGQAGFSFDFDQSVAVDRFVTATATDPAGNTSRFSACVAVTDSGAPGGRPDGRDVAAIRTAVTEDGRTERPVSAPAPPTNPEGEKDKGAFSRWGWFGDQPREGDTPRADGTRLAGAAQRSADSRAAELFVDWGEVWG